MQIAHAIEPRGASWTLNHKCVHLHYDMVKKKVGRYDTRVLLWYLVCYDKILTAQCTLKLIRTIFNLDTLNKKRKHNTRLWFTYICPDAEWIRNYVLIEFILRNIKKTTYIFFLFRTERWVNLFIWGLTNVLLLSFTLFWHINNFAHSMFAQHFNKHVSFGLRNCYEYYVLFLYKTTSVVTLSIST